MKKTTGKKKRSALLHCCDQCSYKTNNSSNLKEHKQARHNIDLTWHKCNVKGCTYKAKTKCRLKNHKMCINDIGVTWHNCDVEGCSYKLKEKRGLKKNPTRTELLSDEEDGRLTFSSSLRIFLRASSTFLRVLLASQHTPSHPTVRSPHRRFYTPVGSPGSRRHLAKSLFSGACQIPRATRSRSFCARVYRA